MAEKSKKCFEIKLYVDGCSRGNPGKSGAGYVIVDMKGETLDSGKKYLGDYLTNNQAEYMALIFGLSQSLRLCRGKVHVLSDSKLLVSQLNRVYRIKNEKLLMLLKEVKNLEQLFEKVDYSYIPREKNKSADKLANDAIDEFLGT